MEEIFLMMQGKRKKTFLGFGLGAVQSGLTLYEAFKSNNFNRFVILEVNREIVAAVKKWDNKIAVNTATRNGIYKAIITDIEIYDPNDPNDSDSIASAIYEADEMATALPSVDFYDRGEHSVARLLAENINPDLPRIIYTAENNNYAAEILRERMEHYAGKSRLQQFQTINTVIGKMGGVIFDERTVAELNLDWMTPHSKAAILVEEFHDIIISKIELSDYKKGIEVFQEKNDLLPFEEAKLFGHNAVHSTLGFFASLAGYTFMNEIRNNSRLYQYGVDAFEKESGAFLLKKYKGFDDPLFTEEGFHCYGTDLLERMTSPYLRDEVQRICRDPVRKLGYDDRFFGAIREALKQNVVPRIFAKAVLGGICYIINNRIDIGGSYPQRIEELDDKNVRSILKNIWRNKPMNGDEEESLNLVCSVLAEFMEEFISKNKITMSL